MDALQKSIREWGGDIAKSPPHSILLIIISAALMHIYGAIVIDNIRRMLAEPLWYHCLAVPFISVWMWTRLKREATMAPTEPWWLGGIFLLALAFILRLGEEGEGGGLLGGASLIVSISAMVALLGGRERLKQASYPILFLVFAIPIPRAIFGYMAFPMQQAAAKMTGVLGNLMGLGVVQDGVVLSMGGFTAIVADECSGLNSLFALLMCGVLIIGLTRAAWYHRVWMFSLIAPSVLLGNLVRLLLMLVMARFLSGDVALSFLHEGSSWVIFFCLLSFLLEIKYRLETGRTDGSAQAIPKPVEWIWRSGGGTVGESQ